MSNLLSSSRVLRGTGALLLALTAIAACAETEDPDPVADAAVPPPAPGLDASTWNPYPDSGFPSFDATITVDSGPGEFQDAAPTPDSSAPVDSGSSDASPAADAGGFLGGLFGDSGLNPDSGYVPPPDGGGGGTPDNPDGWTLNSDSYKDCPALPPPIPIIGGLCTGIYFGCGWTNAKGAKYSCVCDWVHWLCI